MKKSLTSAIALSAVCAAGLVGSLSDSALAAPHSHVSASSASSSAITKYAYKANAFGTKVIVDNVELRTVKDAASQMKCTRRVGRENVKGSLASNAPGGLLPIPNDLVEVSPSTSGTQTYKDGATYGVRGVNNIASVSLGGTVAGVATPTISIDGLRTTANSFHTTKGFDSAASFGYGSFNLDIPQGNPISDTLQTLLDALGVSGDAVNQVIAVPVNILIQTLQQVGTIDLPGLGTVSLGSTRKSVGKHAAYAEAYALKIAVTGTGTPTVLELGRAAARITDGVQAGVFRSTMSALDLNLGDTAQLGNVLSRSLPCEGTAGKLVTQHVASAQVLGGELLKLSGITYAYKGKQSKNGLATGMVSTSIADASIPAVGLDFTGITSKVLVTATGKGHLVKRHVITSIGGATLNGKPLALKTTGNRQTAFAGGLIQLRKISQDNFYGTSVSALVVTLDGENSIINLGQAAGRVFYK